MEILQEFPYEKPPITVLICSRSVKFWVKVFVMGLEYLFYLAPNVVAPFLVKIMPVLEKLCTEQKHQLPSSSTFLHQVGSQPTSLHKLLIQERCNQTFEELHNHWHTFCDATEASTK
jgi:hypothetical protein